MSDPDGTSFASFSSKSIRRGKKAQPEPKPELNLSTALPSSDNFRTSLLMPNLSARFSMLREQDDPTSKIGKANDDSVLFPKRASRLNLFSHHGLSDIAEIGPLDSVRRPFASERADSYHSSEGYGTDDDSSHSGSVMGRPKHREGNNLFGGRQKIYKIPVGGSALAKNPGSASVDADYSSGGRMGGRALYGDDVSTASFQKLWEKECEEDGRPVMKEPEQDTVNDAPTDDRPASPSPAGYNRSRETSSSTASGPSNLRTSTAATSITSQSVVSLHGGWSNSTSSPPLSQHSPVNPTAPVGTERTAIRSRRLYGQGLDQQMHDQQNSALHKLDSLQQRQTVAVAQHLLQSQSAFGLRDHYQCAGSPYAMLGTGTVSPPPLSIPGSPVTSGFGTVGSGPVSPYRDRFPIPHGPTSPDDEDGSVFSSAVQPNDRGKATALGAFNKPNMAYNEQQYSQRQFQLQQARDKSPTERSSSAAASDTDQSNIRRRRDGSDVSSQAPSVSSGWHRDQSLSSAAIHRTQDETAASSDSPNVEMGATSNGTFFAQSSDSEEGSETGNETEEDRMPSLVANSLPRSLSKDNENSSPRQSHDYPTFTPHSPQRLYKDFTQDDSPSRSSAASRKHARNDSLPGKALSDIIDADSPTLGPGSGLSGLVRAHLRNDSGQSSIYPAPSPVLAARPAPERSSSEPVTNTVVSGGLFEDIYSPAWDVEESHGDASDSPDPILDSQGNSWELDDRVGNSAGKLDPPPAEPEAPVAPPLSLRAKQILDQAAALRDQERLRMQHAVSDRTSPPVQARATKGTESGKPWKGLHGTWHQRTESTETTNERQAFASELSSRRRKVQENVKGFAEESRSGSPMPGKGSASNSPTKYANAFGPFKPKPTKGSLAGRQDPSFKAMKMLGMSGSSGANPLPQRDPWEEQEQKRLRDARMGPTGRSSPSSGRPNQFNGSQPMQGFRQRQASDESHNRSARRGPSPPSVSTSQYHSNSANFEERSRRGNGENQDNVETNVVVGARGIPRAPYGEASRFRNTSSPQRRSPDASDQNMRRRSPSAMSGNINTGANAGLYSGTANPSNGKATMEGNSPTTSVPMSPAMLPPKGFQSTGRIPNNRKKSVNKSDISDPTFLSGTSSVNTMNLPNTEGLGYRGEGSSRGFVPPLPPINPRRKTAQQTIANVFGRSETPPTPPTGIPPEQGRSAASERNGDSRAQVRQRLRKSSSDGANLGVRARQAAPMSPPPTVPQSSRNNAGMF